MSHVLFLDDSRLERERISSLGGLLLAKADYDGLRLRFRELKREHLGDEHAPIKWSPSDSDAMFAAQRGLQNQKPLRTAICDLLGEMNGLLMFACIDELAQTYDATKRERYLLQGVEYVCQRAQMQISDGDGLIQVISDLPGSALDGPLARAFHRWHRDGSSSSRYGTTFTHLDRTLLFTHVYLCEGLQLVDFAVGALCQAVKGRGTYYLDRFRLNVRRHAITGQVKGYGIVVYPSNSSVMDAACIYCGGADWPTGE